MNSSGYDPIKKIWSDPLKPPVYNTDAGLGFLILNSLKSTPDRVIEISADDGSETTCIEMYKKSVKICRFLSSLGLEQHDVIGIIGRNSKNLTPLVIACLTLGLPINALAPNADEIKILTMYSNTKPKLIFCDPDLIEKLKRLKEEITLEDSKIFTLLDKLEGFQFIDEIIKSADNNVNDFEIPVLENISSTLAFILDSSGTTGAVKGICKSHKELIMAANPYNPVSDSSECYFYPTTLNWITTPSLIIYCALYGAKRIITAKDLTENLYVEIIQRYDVSVTMFFKLLFNLMAKNSGSFDNVRRVIVSAMVISESVIQKIAKIFPNAEVKPAYGSTECGTISIIENKLQGWSSGKLRGGQVKIVDDDGINLGPNEIGEIYIKKPVLFSGYYNQPEKYAAVIKDGWYKSGDAGYFDDEGFLFVVDRVQFSSNELEIIINEINGVEESAVIGVKKDSVDVITAFVVKTANSAITSEFIEKFVADQVDECKKVTGGVQFVEKLPKTPSSGKIMKNQLREIAEKIHGSN